MIISINGESGSGKTSLANIIYPHLSNKWKQIGFADPVKDHMCKIFNINREFIEEWKRKKENPPGFNVPMREALILFAESCRKINPNCWIDLALKNNSDNLLISDGRKEIEALAVADRNGINIILWRQESENECQKENEKDVSKISKDCIRNNLEYELPDCFYPYHYFIKNDCNLETFHKKIHNKLLPYIFKHEKINNK